MSTRPESLEAYPALTNVNYDRNVLVSIVRANHASSKPAPGFALKKTPKVIRKWPIDWLPCLSCDSVLLVTVFSTYVVYAQYSSESNIFSAVHCMTGSSSKHNIDDFMFLQSFLNYSKSLRLHNVQ